MKTTWLDWFIVACAVLTFLIGAAIAGAQPANAPPVKAPPVKAQSESPPPMVAKSLPLVVFSHLTFRAIDGVNVKRDDSWHPSPAISIYPLGYGQGVVLPANATDAQIRREAGLEQPIRAVPFRRLRAGEVPIVDGSEDVAGRLPFLRDLVPYTSATNTQTTFRRWSGVIVPSSRDSLENKWRVPGGLDGVHGWSSQLLKSRNAVASEFLVRQDPGDHSSAITWGRAYPDGSIFADVLRNSDGHVFEVRVAEKFGDQWRRFVAYRHDAARPVGYVRPTSRQCVECHSSAGRSEYAGAAIPGADGILSDPIDVIERGESVQGGYGLSLGR